MKKFTYSMQNILNLKEKIEEQEKNNYSLTLNKLIEEKEKLNVLYQRKENYEQGLKEAVSEKVIIRLVKQYEESVQVIEEYIKAQIHVVRQQEKTVDLAMQRLNYAMMERKTHEKLKEKALRQYLKECNEEEKKEIDELVSFQYTRKDF